MVHAMSSGQRPPGPDQASSAGANVERRLPTLHRNLPRHGCAPQALATNGALQLLAPIRQLARQPRRPNRGRQGSRKPVDGEAPARTHRSA